MFKKTFLLFLIMVFTLSACTENGIQISGNNQKLDGSGKIITENRDVSGFDKVDLQSIGNLTIVQGTEESLTIKADDNLLPYITTEVFNGTLEIGMKPNLSFNPTQSIEYELVVKSLSSVALSGFGNIKAETLSGTNLEVKLAGSGNIDLGDLQSDFLMLRISGFGNIDVKTMMIKKPTLELTGSGDITVEKMDADDLTVKISGFGNATITGKAGTQDVRILGSGDYNASNLESEKVSIEVSGFGNAKVWAKTDLNVKITGSGNIDYFGNPKLSQTITGFGKVRSLGDHE
jgi:hypothetical protein